MKPRLRPLAFCAALAASALLSGCAFDIVSVKHTPATLTPLGTAAPMLVLQTDASIPIGTGFPTKLKKGTKWRKVGSLPQGDVYATQDQVLTVEASHIHEAQLVLSDRNVIGFYLPVERAFTAASAPVQLAFEPQP